MESYRTDLLSSIYRARERATAFFEKTLFLPDAGWRYTSAHNVEQYPAAILYGTWSGILGLNLLKRTSSWDSEETQCALGILDSFRRKDGSFFPPSLENIPTHKSREYLTLHFTNYSMGAALAIDPQYDFESKYMTRFLDGDYLGYWLDSRSLQRPWEEGNNIVNVGSYLALMNDRGHPKAISRLYQMLEWHRIYQNSHTGGFDCFGKSTMGQRLQSLAGAVHNFHIHLYLEEPFGFESEIARWLPYYLSSGRLTACLSIDFVELAIRTLSFSPDPHKLIKALLFHAYSLLKSQRADGGWLESDEDHNPTIAAGFKDSKPASCSYATWFRLASLGMIAIVLLGDDPKNWIFRKTLGMGYAPSIWPSLPSGTRLEPYTLVERYENWQLHLIPNAKQAFIRIGAKIL